MDLDFSQCKTSEDVKKIFEKQKEECEMIKLFKKQVNELGTVEVRER